MANEFSTSSANKFLHKIIDYAGIFPPASLSIKDSFENFVTYSLGRDAWMLSKFICPFSKLAEFSELAKADYRVQEVNVPLSVIAGPSAEEGKFLEKLNSDLGTASEIMKEIRRLSTIESMELKLPDEIRETDSEEETAVFLDKISEAVKEHFEHRIYLFCEIPFTGDFDSSVNRTVRAIEIHNEKFEDCGFKLRTGGTDASDFPSPETVVNALRQCLIHKVGMKFTAGMHHPFRNFDDTVNEKMHGFVNVFGAGVLAFRHAISDRELKDVITDEDPDDFSFTEDSFKWKDWVCSSEEIHGARNSLVLSFGSCSFDEPTEDLRKFRIIS